MFNANEILPGMWVGAASVAKNSNFMIQKKIELIVNATIETPNYFPHIDYINLKIEDPGAILSPQDRNILTFKKRIKKIIKKIHEYRVKGKNVFIHCQAGIQRSAAIAVAYLMEYVITCIKPSCTSLQCKYTTAVEFLIIHRKKCFFGSPHRVHYREALI